MQRAPVGRALAMGLVLGCSSSQTTRDGSAVVAVDGPDVVLTGEASPPGPIPLAPDTGVLAPDVDPGTIAGSHPGDQGIAGDPRVLFYSDFENGLAGWTRFTKNTDQIAVLTEAALANAGVGYLRAQVTRTQLATNQYISANAQLDLPRRVPELYWRFYARFVGQTATPHHWVRMAAGTASFDSDGLANTVPPRLLIGLPIRGLGLGMGGDLRRAERSRMSESCQRRPRWRTPRRWRCWSRRCPYSVGLHRSSCCKPRPGLMSSRDQESLVMLSSVRA
jgi:hypothetical protein